MNDLIPKTKLLSFIVENSLERHWYNLVLFNIFSLLFSKHASSSCFQIIQISMTKPRDAIVPYPNSGGRSRRDAIEFWEDIKIGRRGLVLLEDILMILCFTFFKVLPLHVIAKWPGFNLPYFPPKAQRYASDL